MLIYQRLFGGSERSVIGGGNGNQGKDPARAYRVTHVSRLFASTLTIRACLIEPMTYDIKRQRSRKSRGCDHLGKSMARAGDRGQSPNARRSARSDWVRFRRASVHCVLSSDEPDGQTHVCMLLRDVLDANIGLLVEVREVYLRLYPRSKLEARRQALTRVRIWRLALDA